MCRQIEAVGKSRILIVETDAEWRALFERIFLEEGYDVETAHSGWDALERIRAHVYHAVVTELEIPELDGVEFILNIRDLRKNLPVVAITRDRDDSTWKVLKKIHVSAYVERSKSPRWLPGVVGLLLENSHSA